MISIETPKKYIYKVELVKTSQLHHEAHSSFQGIIDKILIVEKENRGLSLEELTMFAKGILAGRNKRFGGLR